MSKNKNLITEIVNEIISRLESKETLYECINSSNSFVGGLKQNAIVNNLKFITPTIENSIIYEGIDFELDKSQFGGIIVFSTDVNAIKLSTNKLANFIKQKLSTISNRLNATKKIYKVANKHNLVGWTIGHYFNGRYTAKNGKNFGENSLSIEVVGVDNDTMISIAEDICRDFQQESVLLKLFNGRILFVDPK